MNRRAFVAGIAALSGAMSLGESVLTTDDQAVDNQAPDNQATDDQTHDDQVTNDQVTNDQATNDQVTNDQATDDNEASPPAQVDLIGRMEWLNPPKAWKRSGDKIIVTAGSKTDFWRKTFYGYITDNGHFFSVPVSGDFVFESRIDGKYVALYDQAGLMVRVDPENWMKCGTDPEGAGFECTFDNLKLTSKVENK